MRGHRSEPRTAQGERVRRLLGGRIVVASSSGRQAIMDCVCQLGLAGVVGYLAVDSRRQVLVVGPHSSDKSDGLCVAVERQQR